MTGLVALLHLCDSLFPTGAFAHSDGLEWATDAGRVTRPAHLGAWMDACLEQTIGRCEAPGVWLAWHACAERDWDALGVLNAELRAIRPSATAREASRAMGARLVTTWTQLHPEADLRDLTHHVDVERTMTLPAAFGVVCQASAIPGREAVEGYVYTRLAASASAAMRLMPIGQLEAHRTLASRLARVPAAVDAIVAARDRPGAFAPQMDIAVMSHPYVHSRLFRS